MGAASLTGATTVGGGMFASFGGEAVSEVFLVDGAVNDSQRGGGGLSWGHVDRRA